MSVVEAVTVAAEAVAAAVPWDKEAPSYNDRMKYLATMAAGDADHDFPGIFRTTFAGLPKIGVVDSLDKPNIKFEWKLLNRLLHFRDTGGEGDEDRTGDEKDYQQSFIDTYLPSNEKVEIDTRPVGVKMFNEEVQQYKVKSLYAAPPRTDKKEPREFTKQGADMFNWLDVYGKGSIAFVVDAQNVAFVDALQQGKNPATGKVAYSFITRESVNDPAGKETFDSAGINVRVVNIIDTCVAGITQNIIYPQTPVNYAHRQRPEEMFFSKFDLNVTCINPDERLKSVTMGFTSKSLMKQHVMLKGSKEDAFPGAINTILKNIENLGSVTTWDDKKKDIYFTELQQKRSGDWLQDLCCLDTPRFKLLAAKQDAGYKEFERVFLVTLDRICLAYGLLMGIDVLFTYYVDHTAYLVFFTKSGAAVPPHIQLQNEITNMKTTPLGFAYKDLSKEYNKQHEEALNKIKGALDAEIAKPIPSKTADITARLKTVLKIATDLSTFYTLCAPLEDDGGFFESYGTTKNKEINLEGTSPKDLIKIREQFYAYNRNVVKIKKAHWGKLSEKGNLTITGLKSFFDGFTETIGKSTPAKKDKYMAIDEIFVFLRGVVERASRAFTGLFDKKVTIGTGIDPRKGAGVFSYLNSILDPETKHKIIVFLDMLNTLGIVGDDKLKLESFVVAAKFLIADDAIATDAAGAGSAIAVAAIAPTNEQVPNSELIDSIDVVGVPIPSPNERQN